MAVSVFTSLYHAVSANDMGWLGADSGILFIFYKEVHWYPCLTAGKIKISSLKINLILLLMKN